MKTLTILIFIALIGTAKGIQDRCQFHGGGCSPHATWQNKYDLGEDGQLIQFSPADQWWYFGLKPLYPKYRERFAYSSTLLVGLTDPWHKWATVRLFSLLLIIALLLTYPIQKTFCPEKSPPFRFGLGVLLAYVAHTAGFHLTYTLKLF